MQHPSQKWTCTIFWHLQSPLQCHNECQHKQYSGDGTSYQDCLRARGFSFEDDKLKRGSCGRAHSYWISWVVGWREADMSPLQSSSLLWEWGGGWDRASGRELVPTTEALLETHLSVPPMGLHINFYVVGFKWWIIQTYGEAVHEYITLQGPFQLFPLIQTTSQPKCISFFLPVHGLSRERGREEKSIICLSLQSEPVHTYAYICLISPWYSDGRNCCTN